MECISGCRWGGFCRETTISARATNPHSLHRKPASLERATRLWSRYPAGTATAARPQRIRRRALTSSSSVRAHDASSNVDPLQLSLDVASVRNNSAVPDGDLVQNHSRNQGPCSRTESTYLVESCKHGELDLVQTTRRPAAQGRRDSWSLDLLEKLDSSFLRIPELNVQAWVHPVNRL